MKGKRVSGSWAYLTPALGTIPRYSSTDVCMALDGKVVKATSPLIIVSNIQRYAGIFQVGAKACVNDGKLDVCVFTGEGLFTFMRHAVKALSGRHFTDPKVAYYQCSQIVVESSRALPVHTDGDSFTETPVTIGASRPKA